MHSVTQKVTIVTKMSTSLENNGLATTLFSKARRAILSLLYGRADEAFYLRQIVRATGIGLGPVQRQLKQLTDAGILRRSVRGRQVYYQANSTCPLFSELQSLVIKTSGSGKTIRAPITKQGNVVPRQNLVVPEKEIAEFCLRHHINRLAFFGSVLRNDFSPDSDIDVLVEFEPGYVPGFAIVAMENELSHILGRKVDMRTPKDLSRHFRERVVREARVQYYAI